MVKEEEGKKTTKKKKRKKRKEEDEDEEEEGKKKKKRKRKKKKKTLKVYLTNTIRDTGAMNMKQCHKCTNYKINTYLLHGAESFLRS